jgi:RNA polymerase sigma factor (sigma-70 family)
MALTSVYTEANSGIIERCKQGDRKAFFEIYQLYSKAMFNISLRILNHTGEAEEVLQDSFLKAFDRIGSYDQKFAFGAWLKRIVINGSLDVLKRKKPFLVSLDEAGYAQEDEEEDEPAFEVETIKRCVAELPDGYRTVLSLFLFEEWSHAEIAGALGISEGTSKSQYNRAKKRLIEMIKQYATAHGR